MPPLLFFVLQVPFTNLGHALFPPSIANGIIAGSFTFCKSPTLPFSPTQAKTALPDVGYDLMHYA